MQKVLLSKNLNIRGNEYEINIVPKLKKYNKKEVVGLCDSPAANVKKIHVVRQKSNAELASILIHEILHACLWDLDEEAIQDTEEALITGLTLFKLIKPQVSKALNKRRYTKKEVRATNKDKTKVKANSKKKKSKGRK